MANATATKAQTNAENVNQAIRQSGENGIAIKDLATEVSLSVDMVRRAIKALEADQKVKRTEDKPGMVFPILRRGRRSVEVVDRDEKVYEVIKAAGDEGLALKDVAEKVGCTEHLAYESVWRLRKDERVQREGSTRNAKWVAA